MDRETVKRMLNAAAFGLPENEAAKLLSEYDRLAADLTAAQREAEHLTDCLKSCSGNNCLNNVCNAWSHEE